MQKIMKMPNNSMVRIGSALRALETKHDNVIRIKIPQTNLHLRPIFYLGYQLNFLHSFG